MKMTVSADERKNTKGGGGAYEKSIYYITASGNDDKCWLWNRNNIIS